MMSDCLISVESDSLCWLKDKTQFFIELKTFECQISKPYTKTQNYDLISTYVFTSYIEPVMLYILSIIMATYTDSNILININMFALNL